MPPLRVLQVKRQWWGKIGRSLAVIYSSVFVLRENNKRNQADVSETELKAAMLYYVHA